MCQACHDQEGTISIMTGWTWVWSLDRVASLQFNLNIRLDRGKTTSMNFTRLYVKIGHPNKVVFFQSRRFPMKSSPYHIDFSSSCSRFTTHANSDWVRLIVDSTLGDWSPSINYNSLHHVQYIQ